ncbi:MAG: FMN-binding negative transcriptional regulator [Chloroflexota bacterium]|nr:FMN-binding negative transcriptional regulator [Chloroflexota bacterium]
MYIPPAFRESRSEVLHEIIRRYSFGTLVSHVDGELFSTHLPFLLHPTRGTHGTLVAHMARANPHWRGFQDGAEVLALFQGPHSYVSPRWYATPAAVPTWNYTAVHAYGRPRLVEDETALRALLEDTVRLYEGTYDDPWSTDRLDEDLVAKLVQAIVGFEIPISRLEGKLKLNQNRSLADRQGVITALLQQGDPQGVEVARLMQLHEPRD